MEIFKTIPNTNNLYEVSNTGIVRSVKSNKCLSQKTKSNGYKEVALYVDKIGKSKYVHRLVVQTFICELNNKIVNHIDGNKANNNLYNLELVTYSENSLHSVNVLGNKPSVFKGSKHGMAKIDENIVLLIRNKYSKDNSIKKLSNEFNIPYSTIAKICYNVTWKHI
jgi:hypothetical protein